MRTLTLSIGSRFCGPPDSANGGYAVGAIAQSLGCSSLDVTLRSPPPLDAPMKLKSDTGKARLLAGERLVAEVVTDVDVSYLKPPPPPSYAQAERSSEHYIAFGSHPFPRCFVCGPARAEHDGLRIFAGAEPGQSVVAAPWTPSMTLEQNGAVSPEALWAAMDCPGYFAVGQGEPAVLGRLRGELTGAAKPDTACVVVAWPISRDGRKLKAGTALFTEEGQRLGVTEQTWIVLRK